MCLAHYERLLSLWGYLYFPGKKLGWGFYSLMLTNVRLAEKKAPPLGLFTKNPCITYKSFRKNKGPKTDHFISFISFTTCW